MTVMKFGGTSVGTARVIRQAIENVVREQRNGAPLVVLSACSGMTNTLIRLADVSAKDRKSVV